ncbi:MAG: HAD family phosphatase [Candidatus Heimdallarchaeota archaeon]|nr:HAD family phosphatase [Candidatus Heimdallarchaeota archaeon]
MTDLSHIEAVIFDCDGVLVNSEALSCYALNVVFEENFGIDIGTNYSPIIGTSLDFALNYYFKKYDVKDYDIEELKLQKEKAYFSLAESELDTFDLCESFIQLLRFRSIKIAVASSGSHEKIEFSLNEVDLLKYFENRYSSQDVKNGKPHPDLFLHTAESIGVSPDKCLVIEDSVNGIIAGVNAGMNVIGFPGSFPNQDLMKAGATYLVKGYYELMKWFP